jgi:hypothetical protein
MMKNKNLWIFACAIFVFVAFSAVLVFFPSVKDFFLAAISNANVSIIEPACSNDSDCETGQKCSAGSCLAVEENQGGGGTSVWYEPTIILPENPPAEVSIPQPLVEETEVLPPLVYVQPEQLPEENQVEPSAPPEKNIVVKEGDNADLLPQPVVEFSNKIPEFSQILSNLGITNTAEAATLKNYNFLRPGIKEITGSSFLYLTSEQKNMIPEEMVFVLAGDKNIDVLTQLDFSNNLLVLEKAKVLAGKLMSLVVKAKTGAKKVSGQMFFKSGDEEKFSILKFNYKNEDYNIYSADIKVPVTAGEYEITTSIDYDINGAEKKDIQTITLVDPEGYVYEKVGDQELRINNATVSLYSLNDKDQYELWPAKKYGQENPQTTNSTGKYSFLVPEGTYYLAIQSPGYYSYKSVEFSVSEGKEVHSNIALKRQIDLWSFLNWNTIILIILSCFVAYNFFRDWKRNRR